MKPDTLYDLFAYLKCIENIVNFMDDKTYSIFGILIEPFIKNIKETLEEEELRD